MTNEHDLHSYVQATQQELQEAEQVADAQDAKRRRGRRNILGILLVIVFLGGVAALVVQKDDLRYWLFGPSAETVRADLDTLLTAAAESINDYRQRKGALPDKIPLPGVDDLVTYSRTEDGHYTLTATLGAISQEKTY